MEGMPRKEKFGPIQTVRELGLRAIRAFFHTGPQFDGEYLLDFINRGTQEAEDYKQPPRQS
jgi:hypothetical protein